jgi:hypothetical protein
MSKQMSLRLVSHADLLTLWNELPEKCRRDVLGTYANLIARAAKSHAQSKTKSRDESQPTTNDTIVSLEDYQDE